MERTVVSSLSLDSLNSLLKYIMKYMPDLAFKKGPKFVKKQYSKFISIFLNYFH